MIKDKIQNFLENLSEDEVKNLPVAKKLDVIYQYPEIKLTKKGNLPTKIVDELIETGLLFRKPEKPKEDHTFEIKLFKNLLIDSRLFRKSKNKLLQTKKYQKLSLKEKVLMLFESLEMKVILDTVFSMEWYVKQTFKEYFLFMRDIDEFLYKAVMSVGKERKLTESILQSVLYEFGVLKNGKLQIDFKLSKEKVKTDEIINPEDINERVAKLFLIAILENGECDTCDEEDMLIIQKIYNTMELFVTMEEDDYKYYEKWLRKMGQNLKKFVTSKEFALMDVFFDDISAEVRSDIMQVLLMSYSYKTMNKKEKDDFLMYFAMTVCEIYLNRHYGLFNN